MYIMIETADCMVGCEDSDGGLEERRAAYGAEAGRSVVPGGRHCISCIGEQLGVVADG